ncbi:MAG: hypothetical protein QM703_28950 [Gemmatales bacterium]
MLLLNKSVFLAFIFVMLPGIAMCQQQRFGDVPFKPFNGQVVIQASLNNQTPIELTRIGLRPALDNAWTRVKQQGEDQLRKKLGGMKLTGGVSLYDVKPGLANRLTLEARADPAGATIHLKAPGNFVYVKSTTPDLDLGIFGSVGLSRHADPKVRIDFDIEAEVAFQCNIAGTASVQVRSVTITNVHTRGANLTGWLGHAFADVLKFFGGPDLRSALQLIIKKNVNDRVAKQVSQLGSQIHQKLPTLPFKPSYVLFGMAEQHLTVHFSANNGSTASQIK